MLLRVLLGAAAGMIVGHLIPPGYFFWFIVGGVGGFLLQRYSRY